MLKSSVLITALKWSLVIGMVLCSLGIVVYDILGRNVCGAATFLSFVGGFLFFMVRSLFQTGHPTPPPAPPA